MTRPRPRVSRSPADSEDGVALIAVIGMSFVMMLIVTAVLSHALGGFKQAVHEEHWTAALQAAEAGVDDYLFRLEQDSAYWRFDATALPPDGNEAFTGSVPLAGAANRAAFRYVPDASQLPTTGLLHLLSTGTVDDVERTVEVTLRRRNFLDYLYFTDLETVDPAAYPSSQQQWAQSNCSRYQYADPPRDTACRNIYFYGDGSFRDEIHGPLHTNDAMRIYGRPRFLGETSSSWPDGTTDACGPVSDWIDGTSNGSSDPEFERDCDPVHLDVLPLPASNQELRSHADPALGGAGCLLTGPTKIELLADGRMRVWSPFSRGGNCPVVDGTPTAAPANGVIYVQNVPNDPADPDHTSGCPFADGHPFAADLDPQDVTTYGCRDGDLFVWGTSAGRLTLAAQNDINVVWHLRYADGSGTDVVGLIANNYVQVYHPWGCTSIRRGRCQATGDLPARFHDRHASTPFRDPVIEAAILALEHSFRIQNHDRGDPLGTLSVRGAIAQKYRGAVGTFSAAAGRVSTGFEKDYRYDERLRYLSPPHFLDPVQSAWRVVTWAE